MYSNETEVIAQMEAFGLDLELGKNPLKYNERVRTKVSGRKGKQGWYKLYDDLTIDDPERPGYRVTLITGAFGYFKDGNAYVEKVALNKDALPKISPEQRAENARRQAEAERISKAENEKRHATAALQAQWVWHRCERRGHSAYEEAKLIRGTDIRYSPANWAEHIGSFPKDLFQDPDLPDPPTNSIAIPIRDIDGNVTGLSFVLDKATHREKIARREGNNKEYWPRHLEKKGRFYQIGPMITHVALVCEGWATGESLLAATGLPVIVAFDAYNIEAVLAELLPYYTKAHFLICADDDALWECRNCKGKINLNRVDDQCPHCGQPHRRTNVGVQVAVKCCAEDRVHWVRPKFPDEDERFALFEKKKCKLTDYNDLHVCASLSVVRRQLEGVLRQHHIAGEGGAVIQNRGGGETALRRIETVPDALERYSLIYAQKGTVFDHELKLLMSKDDMRDVCNRQIMNEWSNSKHRRIYQIEQVGFDPTEQDDNIICNLWKGWPTTPRDGDCGLILDLLKYLCSGEDNADEIYDFVLNWCAYPLQNPGAKMSTAVVIHGGQGCGKNLFAEAVMGIYGEFGKVIDQDCLEDKHNDFFSKKLLLVADEIIGRSDRYHHVNKLKGIITGKKIRINPKNIASYDETNHINMFFLANGFIPVVIEQDDRRHAVIYAPEKREKSYYIAVSDQIKNGGVEALHQYLLHKPLGNFNPHAPPPLTQAKATLIDLNKDAFPQFYEEFIAGEVGNVPNLAFQGDDLWELFKAWCLRKGERPGKQKYMIADLVRRPGVDKLDRQWVYIKGEGRVRRSFYSVPGAEEREQNTTMEMYYSECVERFQAAVNAYRNMGKNYGTGGEND